MQFPEIYNSTFIIIMMYNLINQIRKVLLYIIIVVITRNTKLINNDNYVCIMLVG
jgi:hypothetical protein